MTKIRVLLADDHAVVRDGLRVLLSTEPDLEIAGEAATGDSAVRLACQLQPQVVLLDLSMPQGNGLSAARSIRRQAPASRVLVLSAYSDENSVQSLMEAGASGYLTKHAAAEDLLQAIREVSQGRTFFSPAIVHRMRGRARGSFERGQRLDSQPQLTRREGQVLNLIAAGLGNKQIAGDLALSIKTVEKHRQAIMDKLDIHETAGLTRYALGKESSGPAAALPDVA